MKQVILRWACLLVAMFVLGPIAGSLIGSLRAPDGGPAATALLNESMPKGVLLTMLVIVMAGVIGVVGSKLTTWRVGLFGAGLVLTWGAFSAGQLNDVLRRTHTGSTYWTLAGEGLLLGAVVLAVAWVILKVSRQPEEASVKPSQFGQAGNGLLVTIAVGCVVGALVARSELVGQTVAAAIAAGTFGALIGRVVSSTAPTIVFIAGGVLLAVIGPMSGALVDGGAAIERLYAGHTFPLARVMPLDWLGGVLIGVPVGTWWASSMVEKHAPEDVKA